jgi:hypothetical protein
MSENDVLVAGKRFGVLFKSWLASIDRLAEIDSLKQAKREAQSELQAVRAETTAMKAERDQLAVKIKQEIEAELSKQRGELQDLVR